MKQVLLIAKTEYVRNLSSPISISFIGAFLLSTYLLFFNQGSFFARNVADLWPLFHNLPLLLILVVSALAMRGWAEEQQRRQSEHLFSLPVPYPSLGSGTFLRGHGTDCHGLTWDVSSGCHRVVVRATGLGSCVMWLPWCLFAWSGLPLHGTCDIRNDGASDGGLDRYSPDGRNALPVRYRICHTSCRCLYRRVVDRSQ